jgi:parallel beta-helix repeat protein
MAIYTVTRTVDDTLPGSLRRAILDANGNAGIDTIAFNLPGTGTQTIIAPSGLFTDTLPEITDPVIIDGTTQPGFAGTPIVKVEAQLYGVTKKVFDISAGGSTIKGLVIEAAANSAIVLRDRGGNTVVGNWFTKDFTGNQYASTSTFDGISIVNSPNNTIGGTNPADRNLITGPNTGIRILGATSTGNRVIGNFIGTNASGTDFLRSGANGYYGVDNGIVIKDAPNNIIGGTTAAERNIISANSFTGVTIDGLRATQNRVVGNYIGSDVSGNFPLGNYFDGIDVINGAASNVIENNLISSNGAYGVKLASGSTGNKVIGNLIGTNLAGNADRGNYYNGIFISDSSNNIIGGTTSAERNIISGNGNGILLSDATASNNQIIGNYIGTDITGNTALKNDSIGIYVRGGKTNIIRKNLISGNGSFSSDSGIALEGAEQSQIQGNLIGINASGTSALANGGSGISVSTTSINNIIGGVNLEDRNIISGNKWDGLIILGSGNSIFGNFIGTSATGINPIPNQQFQIQKVLFNTDISR